MCLTIFFFTLFWMELSDLCANMYVVQPSCPLLVSKSDWDSRPVSLLTVTCNYFSPLRSPAHNVYIALWVSMMWNVWALSFRGCNQFWRKSFKANSFKFWIENVGVLTWNFWVLHFEVCSRVSFEEFWLGKLLPGWGMGLCGELLPTAPSCHQLWLSTAMSRMVTNALYFYLYLYLVALYLITIWFC